MLLWTRMIGSNYKRWGLEMLHPDLDLIEPRFTGSIEIWEKFFVNRLLDDMMVEEHTLASSLLETMIHREEK